MLVARSYKLGQVVTHSVTSRNDKRSGRPKTILTAKPIQIRKSEVRTGAAAGPNRYTHCARRSSLMKGNNFPTPSRQRCWAGLTAQSLRVSAHTHPCDLDQRPSSWLWDDQAGACQHRSNATLQLQQGGVACTVDRIERPPHSAVAHLCAPTELPDTARAGAAVGVRQQSFSFRGSQAKRLTEGPGNHH